MSDCRPGALSRAARLRTPEQFAAATGERATWRAARQWLAASARVEPQVAGLEQPSAAAIASDSSGESVDHSASAFHLTPETGRVRFGFTVSRRQARRAVQRAMVKRVLREAARVAAGTLNGLARDARVDVVLRLRAPLPPRSEMSLSQVKRTLRSEADSLISQLARHLRADAR
jgi:ribonuclease P protein component